MPILTIVLGSLLVVAMIYIAVQHLTHWLEKHGGFTIRIVVEDDNDF